jgi:hypothetical protein
MSETSEPRSTPVVEHCREWVDEKFNRCGEPAVVIFWGRLFDPEALGPRCEDHTSKHLNGRYWKTCVREHWALFDLTDLHRG